MSDKLLSDFGDIDVKFTTARPIKARKGKRGKGKGSDKILKAKESLHKLCFRYRDGECSHAAARNGNGGRDKCNDICPNWRCCNPSVKKRYKISKTKTFMGFFDLIRKDKRYKHLIPGVKTHTVKTAGKKRVKMAYGGSNNEVQGTLR